MKVIEIDKSTNLVKKLPDASKTLGKSAAEHFKRLGKILMDAGKLKGVHIPALEIFSVNYAQWEWAVQEIESKNKEQQGSGYIQKFKTGAKNLSVEVTLRRDAEKAMMQSIKQFGLDPKSEKELFGAATSDSTDLFEAFENRKNG